MIHSVMLELAELWADQSGVTTVEYAILLMLVAIGSIGVWQTFGARVAAVVEVGGEGFDPDARP